MSTKIILNYHIPSKLSFTLANDSFVCKEEPYEVLKKLITKHSIYSYKDVSSKIIHRTPGIILSKDLHSKIRGLESSSFRKLNLPKDQYTLFYSLEINNLFDEDIPKGFSNPTSSIDDFDNFLIKPSIKNQPYQISHPKEFLSGLIEHNLVSYGFETFYALPKRNRAPIVKKVNNYLETREKKQVPDLENNLNIIMEFAHLLVRKPIGVAYLKSLHTPMFKKGDRYTTVF